MLVFVVLLVSLPFCWLLCRFAGLCLSAGFSAALLASLPLCWLFCRSAGVLLALWSTGRQPLACLFVCLCFGVFLLLVTLPPCWFVPPPPSMLACLFSCPIFSVCSPCWYFDVCYCLIYVRWCLFSLLDNLYLSDALYPLINFWSDPYAFFPNFDCLRECSRFCFQV